MKKQELTQGVSSRTVSNIGERKERWKHYFQNMFYKEEREEKVEIHFGQEAGVIQYLE